MEYRREKLSFAHSWRGTYFTYCRSTLWRENLHILKTWAKDGRESAKSQTSLDFMRRRNLFLNERFLDRVLHFYRQQNMIFFNRLDRTTLDTSSFAVITCAGLQERRDCEVHGVLSAANDKSRNCCFTSRRERPCLWRKLFPALRLAPVIRLLYPVTSKARAYFPLAAPNVASPAIFLAEKLQAAWAYLKNRWSDWWSLLERIPP